MHEFLLGFTELHTHVMWTSQRHNHHRQQDRRQLADTRYHDHQNSRFTQIQFGENQRDAWNGVRKNIHCTLTEHRSSTDALRCQDPLLLGLLLRFLVTPKTF